MDARKKELLEMLEKELKKDDSIGQMSIFTAKELGTPMDILRAEIMEFGPDLISVLGEFLFMPFEDEGVLFFTSVITLSGTVPKGAAPDLAAAVARLNYNMPLGCFALGDDDKNLIFKFTTLIDAGDKKEKQASAVSRSVEMALSVSDRYMSFLLPVINNDMTVDEMVEMLKGGNKE